MLYSQYDIDSHDEVSANELIILNGLHATPEHFQLKSGDSISSCSAWSVHELVDLIRHACLPTPSKFWEITTLWGCSYWWAFAISALTLHMGRSYCPFCSSMTWVCYLLSYAFLSFVVLSQELLTWKPEFRRTLLPSALDSNDGLFVTCMMFLLHKFVHFQWK